MSWGAIGGSVAGALVTGAMSKKSGGGAVTPAPQVDLNRTFRIGDTSLTGGILNLDPQVAGLRTNFLNRVNQVTSPGGTFDFGSRYRGLSDEFAGNQGSLINARLNPLRQNIAQRRGGLQRDLGRRGVMGTFANQAVSNFDIDAGRALGDAEAMATNDALMARTNLLGAEQGAESALTQLLGATSNDVLRQELAGLGLGVDSIAALLSAANQAAAVNRPGLQSAADRRNAIDAAVAGTVGQGVSDYFSTPRTKTYTGTF